MSWEQMTLALFPEPAPQPYPAADPRAAQTSSIRIWRRPAALRKKTDVRPELFNTWTYERAEFDRAFLRGMRSSAEHPRRKQTGGET